MFLTIKVPQSLIIKAVHDLELSRKRPPDHLVPDNRAALEHLKDAADLGLSQAESGGGVEEGQELLHQVREPEELLHSNLLVIWHVNGWMIFLTLVSL